MVETQCAAFGGESGVSAWQKTFAAVAVDRAVQT
jgi:hypothetical protein